MNSKSGDSASGFTLRRVCNLLDGGIICSDQLVEQRVAGTCGCDLTSDVIAGGKLYEMEVRAC